MTILGLETSTAVCSVGLFREGKSGIERSLRETHIHSEKLLTLVQEVLCSGGIALGQLDAVAVSIGPGSFTGLRIGLSTAKGLSYALDKPIIAVPTFEAIAEAARQRSQASESIVVLIDAKKEEWYVGHFQVVEESVRPSGPVQIRRLADAVHLIQGQKSLLVLTDQVEAIKQSLDNAVTIEDVYGCCRGDIVASVAQARFIKREFADASALEPMYLKDFVVRSVAAAS